MSRLKMIDKCMTCNLLMSCYYNSFRNCPRIEMAVQGLGIPTRQQDKSYLEHIPFGVYMGLKHIVNKIGVNVNDNKHNGTKTWRNPCISRKAR